MGAAVEVRCRGLDGMSKVMSYRDRRAGKEESRWYTIGRVLGPLGERVRGILEWKRSIAGAGERGK